MSIFEVTGYQKISPEQAKKIMDENEDCIILDVRSDEEYAEQRIANAMLIPDFEIAERAETDLSDKDALILVYCRRGYRSATAAHTLIDLGYTQVYDFGGIEDWPYETLN
ncbi:MAG: rhodanese-like domain-containing protein [Oscillospiraceae bacterium]|nr:rhodanese-like domain-containing protein [Oscillospiraceae bacterium]